MHNRVVSVGGPTRQKRIRGNLGSREPSSSQSFPSFPSRNSSLYCIFGLPAATNRGMSTNPFGVPTGNVGETLHLIDDYYHRGVLYTYVLIAAFVWLIWDWALSLELEWRLIWVGPAFPVQIDGGCSRNTLLQLQSRNTGKVLFIALRSLALLNQVNYSFDDLACNHLAETCIILDLRTLSSYPALG